MTRQRPLGRASRAYWAARAALKARRDPCALCGEPIDYSLPARHRWAFTADHITPLHLDPDQPVTVQGLRAAHNACNAGRGARLDRSTAAAAGEPETAHHWLPSAREAADPPDTAQYW